MTDITFSCPYCKTPLTVAASHAGAEVQCPKCTCEIRVPSGQADRNEPRRRSNDARDSAIQKVVVTDFDMKFTSMVNFMLKWALASIPAAIILLVIVWAAMILLGVVGGTATR